MRIAKLDRQGILVPQTNVVVLLLPILTSNACCSRRSLQRKLQSFGIKYADDKEVCIMRFSLR